MAEVDMETLHRDRKSMDALTFRDGSAVKRGPSKINSMLC